MKFVAKSLKNVLASKQADESAAEKMVSIGKRRRAKVKKVVSESIKQGKTTKQIERKLKKEAKVKREPWRDWGMVATTEVTDSNAKASLDLIEDMYGQNAAVYRDTRDCCPECCLAFGMPGKPKHYVLRMIPDNLKGAVHPRCKCSPWKPVSSPDIFKAALYPIGLVSRSMKDDAPEYMISTGNNKWVGLGSVTARYIVRYVLRCIPYVLVDEINGYKVARHGHGKPRDRIITLLNPNAIGNSSFYNINPFEFSGQDRKLRMMQRKSFDEYLAVVANIMPSVVAMPEYWERPTGMKHLSDFMGYKTMTDWKVVIPGDIPKNAVIFRQKIGLNSVRSAVRTETKKMLFEGDLKKEG